MRGHWLTIRSDRLEDAPIEDFLDVTYNYSINVPETRFSMRTAMLTYLYGMDKEVKQDEDMTFEGFSSSALSMLDELDSFNEVG